MSPNQQNLAASSAKTVKRKAVLKTDNQSQPFLHTYQHRWRPWQDITRQWRFALKRDPDLWQVGTGLEWANLRGMLPENLAQVTPMAYPDSLKPPKRAHKLEAAWINRKTVQNNQKRREYHPLFPTDGLNA